MKAHIKSGNGRLLIEVEGESIKDLFRAIAEAQEILDADAACGACGSQVVKHHVRDIDKFTYFELRCECGAALAFGQLKEGGGLFPKRKGADGKELPNRGWVRYIGPGKDGK